MPDLDAQRLRRDDVVDHGRPWPGWFAAGQAPPRGSRWFIVVLAQLIQLPFLVWLLASHRDSRLAIASVAAFAASYLLLLVRRHPGPTIVFVAVVTAPALLLVRVGPPVALVPLAFAVVAGTARGARAWAWWTVAVAAVGAVAFGAFADTEDASFRPIALLLVLCILIAIGEAIRTRRERFRQIRALRERRRQSETEQERLRIARELHDVLAHSLSSINVQAGVGLHLMAEHPERAADALANIRDTSKSALDEVRGVLGFLRADGDTTPLAPEPELSRLPALVTSMSALGVDVSLVDELPADRSTGVQRAIYRIVQESLTNVSRHSDAATARVELRSVGDVDVVRIVDGSTNALAGVEGRGILGMRERAEQLGGVLTAAPGPDGSFVVEARIPHLKGAPA